MSRRWIATVLAVLGTVALPAGAADADGKATFAPVACPASVGTQVDCHEARDANGAWLLVAMPKTWNRRLIVHAHGGPRLGAPKAGDSAEDLDRFAVMVRSGYAWIGSTYRRGGYGVRMAAADVDVSRRVFWSRWGRPERTLLHGQSWGGNVAAKVAELYALDIDGRANYDGVLTTNGLLSGGTRGYGFRADLRAVYQYYCRNHPAADEAQYPLWQGLPAGAKMTRDDLRTRVDACTGVDQSASKRTPAQAANLRDILAVTGVAEKQLVAHLAWGTFHFQDVVQKRLGGRNPFDNHKTVYRGSRDDRALNAGVERFSADPAAVAMLAYDADLSGLIVRPTVTVHARHDPTVSYEAEAIYAATVEAAGRSDLLLQALTDESDHSRLQDATYASALQVLEQWLDSGKRPAATAFADTCGRVSQARDACRFIAP
ncbi:hypothetical protein [Pseudoxanthomonas sp.]|uniref:hypothetical protein n=1 Tax=Pseudoxanthomonas sp. TaxID=1871049 RepID=UPI002FE29EFA